MTITDEQLAAWATLIAGADPGTFYVSESGEPEYEATACNAFPALVAEVQRLRGTYEAPGNYACHCDLEPHMEPDGCVLDYGCVNDCIYAKGAKERGGKHTCEYWRPVANAIDWMARAAAAEAEAEKLRDENAQMRAAFGDLMRHHSGTISALYVEGVRWSDKHASALDGHTETRADTGVSVYEIAKSAAQMARETDR